MKKIAVLIIATNKYTQFVSQLISSFDSYFFINKRNEYKITFYIYTDHPEQIEKRYDIETIEVPHKPWPGSTLYRFKYFKDNWNIIEDNDYFIYIDADTKLVGFINDDILSSFSVVNHCGFVQRRGSYETNPQSTAYVADNEGTVYVGGGFYLANAERFKHLVDTCSKNIETDDSNNIVAVWHDESHLNRYIIDNPPEKILSPEYHYPEDHEHIYSRWKEKGVSYSPKILLLKKNHNEIR